MDKLLSRSYLNKECKYDFVSFSLLNEYLHVSVVTGKHRAILNLDTDFLVPDDTYLHSFYNFIKNIP